MLYDDIHKLEKTWPDFNKESFTSEDIVTLAERIGILTITDKTISSASAFHFENRPIILYNPQQCETNLVMALGHELGHFGLGHVEMDDTFLYTSSFTASVIEKDAVIIGFLFWLPHQYWFKRSDKVSWTLKSYIMISGIRSFR